MMLPTLALIASLANPQDTLRLGIDMPTGAKGGWDSRLAADFRSGFVAWIESNQRLNLYRYTPDTNPVKINVASPSRPGDKFVDVRWNPRRPQFFVLEHAPTYYQQNGDGTVTMVTPAWLYSFSERDGAFRRDWSLALPRYAFALTCSPDGSTIACTPGQQGMVMPESPVQLIDSAHGKVRRILTGLCGQCGGLVFTPDSKILVGSSGESDRTQFMPAARRPQASVYSSLQAVSGPTGKDSFLQEQSFSSSPIDNFDYGRDAEPPKGKAYLCAWRTFDGSKIQLSAHHRGMSVQTPILLADDAPTAGVRMLTVGEDKTMRLWNLKTGAQLAKITLKQDVHLLGKLNGSGIVVSQTDATSMPWEPSRSSLLVFDPIKLRQLGRLPDEGMVPSRTGGLAVTWRANPRVAETSYQVNSFRLSLREYGKGQPRNLRTIDEFTGDTREVEIDEGAKCAIVVSDRGLITLSAKNHVDLPPGLGSKRVSLTTDADGRCAVWVHGQLPTEIESVYPDGIPWRTIPTKGQTGARVASPTRMWEWDRDSLRLLDLETSRTVIQRQYVPPPTSVASSDDGERTAQFVPPKSLVVFDGSHPQGKTIALDFDRPEYVKVCVSSDGSTILASDPSKGYVLRRDSLAQIALPKGEGPGELSPSGEYAVVQDEGTPVTLISLKDRQRLVFPPDSALRFSESRHLLSVRRDNDSVEIYDLDTYRRIRTITPHDFGRRRDHTMGVSSAAFAPDALSIAVLYSDGTLLDCPVSLEGGPLRTVALKKRQGALHDYVDLRFAPDGSQIVVRLGADIVAVEPSTMRERWRKDLPTSVEALAYSSDGSSLYFATDRGMLWKAAVSDGRWLDRSYVPAGGLVRTISSGRSPDSVVLHTWDHEGVSIIEGSGLTRRVRANFASYGSPSIEVASSQDGSLSALWFEGQNAFAVCKTQTGEIVFSNTSGFPIRNVTFSADLSAMLVSSAADEMSGVTEHLLWRLADKKLVAIDHVLHDFQSSNELPYGQPILDPRGQFFCTTNSKGTISVTSADQGETRRFGVPNADGGSLTFKAAALSPDGGKLILATADGRIAVLDPSGKSKRVSIHYLGLDYFDAIVDEAPFTLVFSSHTEKFAFRRGDLVLIYRWEGEGLTLSGSFTLSGGRDIRAVSFRGSDYIYGESETGTCWLRSFDNGDPVLEISPGPTGGWVASTVEGRYDGDRQALASANLVRGLNYIPLERLTYADVPETMHRAGLIQEIVSGKPLSIAAFNTSKFPSVRMDELPSRTGSRNINVGLSVTDAGTGLSKLWVWQNGRLSVVKDLSSLPSGKGRVVVDLRLEAGANDISVCAFSSSGARSPRATKRVQYVGKPLRHRLFALVVGTGDCQTPRYGPLAGPAIDVRNVEAALKKSGVADDSEEPLVLPIVEGASPDGVENLVQRIANEIRREEVDATFVFYYSGHGRLDRSEYQLLMHDEVGGSAFVGIDRLRRWSEMLLGASQVWVIDACDSRGALSGLSALQQAFVAENRGLCVIAGTDATGLASNRATKTGLLTDIFLNAMHDEGSARNGDIDAWLLTKIVAAKAQHNDISPFVTPSPNTMPIWMGKLGK